MFKFDSLQRSLGDLQMIKTADTKTRQDKIIVIVSHITVITLQGTS